jgi:hypothetical protein
MKVIPETCGMQWYAVVCSGMWYAVVCSGMQWYAVVCSGMQWYAVVCTNFVNLISTFLYCITCLIDFKLNLLVHE